MVVKTNKNKFVATLERVPKTSITAIVSAIIIYSLGKGWIGQQEAELLSQVMIALGIGSNMLVSMGHKPVTGAKHGTAK